MGWNDEPTGMSWLLLRRPHPAVVCARAAPLGGNAAMGAVVEMMLGWADHAFEREGWHVSLLDSVKGLTAHQAAWAPSPERNSIWKVVEHVALWKEEGARRILGEPPHPSGWAKEHDWRPIVEVSEAGWQGAVRRLIQAHAAVKAAMAERSDADLQMPIGATIRGLILHDSYHCGQICYLRALQGTAAKIW